MGSQSFLRVIVCIVALIGSAQAQLQLGFYSKTCPKAEKIIQNFVNEHIRNAPSSAASLIRMHFHDCFVRFPCEAFIVIERVHLDDVTKIIGIHNSQLMGCDASVLLNSTNNQAERDAPPNLTVRGFGFIDNIKSLVEAECPGVVSCADIIALAARDSIIATGGPFWNVPTGRRDGTVSNLTEARNNIPAPTSNFSTLQTLFANQGLDLQDLVLLSAAHSIGYAHCNPVHNFTGVGDQDPALDSEHVTNQKTKCKHPNDNTTLIQMVPGTSKKLDLSYYDFVLKSGGLFQSDAALLANPITRYKIVQLRQGSVENFFAEFAKSMEKMGRINVKTGTNGEIRKHCAVVNI